MGANISTALRTNEAEAREKIEKHLELIWKKLSGLSNSSEERRELRSKFIFSPPEEVCDLFKAMKLKLDGVQKAWLLGLDALEARVRLAVKNCEIKDLYRTDVIINAAERVGSNHPVWQGRLEKMSEAISEAIDKARKEMKTPVLV